MKNSDLERIEGNFFIYSNGKYVVLPGKKLYIFMANGSLVACRKDLPNAGKITFLSGDRMLLCSSKAVFHMVNLCDGNDIWTAPYTKIELNIAPMTVSQEESFVYTFDTWQGNHFISRLNLTSREVTIHDMYMDSGATRDIMCNNNGVPCLLKTLRETIGGQTFHQCGVRIHDFDDIAPGNTTSWETKWSFDEYREALCFQADTNSIITTDLHIYNPSTGNSCDLLANETTWKHPQQSPSACWLDSSKQYLCVMYGTVNVIIDLHARKVAAQYAADFTRGCLIGNEYWVCEQNRILRKPFPAFEDVPPVKTYRL